MRTAFDPESAIVNEVSIFGLLTTQECISDPCSIMWYLLSLYRSGTNDGGLPYNVRFFFSTRCFFRIQLEPSARDWLNHGHMLSASTVALRGWTPITFVGHGGFWIFGFVRKGLEQGRRSKQTRTLGRGHSARLSGLKPTETYCERLEESLERVSPGIYMNRSTWPC
jgi:hypothetical protein